MKGRSLTKSRFKVGLACPTKLHFLDNPAYGNSNVDNAFLKALADGGFQVGELAKLYFPGGVNIETLDKELALKQTHDLLKNENAIIYEAALQFGNLFIRTDILVKIGNTVRVIEVKAKSYLPSDENQFYTKTSLKKGSKKINSTWEPYLIDIAYQCYVATKALPDSKIMGSLMLADKSSVATVDGLNQRFVLKKDSGGRVYAEISEAAKALELGNKILIEVPVNEEIATIFASDFESGGKLYKFNDLVDYLSETCRTQSFAQPAIGPHCKSCEFKFDSKDQKLKSGFEKCWKTAGKLTERDFNRDFVFDIWNFRKANSLIEKGKLFIDQLTEEDLNPTSNANSRGLSSSERQWMQVEKILTKDQAPYIDIPGLASEFSKFRFPLHFIDFETTTVAIPFNAGRRPYEQIAFQFSHHIVDKDGYISHCDEYINREKGRFPNFEFVRALMNSLFKDQGTIFRYATHENTVLNQIKHQLLECTEPIDDKQELIAFIDSIINYTDSDDKFHEGDRCMVDLCELVKSYYYNPLMKGSNSIKKVLPAILNSSGFLKTKYSQPIYGSNNGPGSRNFSNWTWIVENRDGSVVDPYKLLPPIFDDIELEEMDALLSDGSIADGGAAMAAYSRMQFSEMTALEADRVQSALLKYCELDTFAMVLIWEYWSHEIKSSKAKVA